MGAKTRVRIHRYRHRPHGLIWQHGQRSGEVSSGTTDYNQALLAAGRLLEQLENGIIPGSSIGQSITWAEFRLRYEREWLERMSDASQRGWRQAANHFERICQPKRLAAVDKAMLSKFRGELEAMDIATTSVRSYYRALHAGLGWAESVDLIEQVPRIRQRKQAKAAATMRNRAITAEEFDRLIAKLRINKHGKPMRDKPAFDRFAGDCGLAAYELTS